LSNIKSSEFVYLSDWWAGMQYNFYVDKEDYDKYFGKEHAILILNHKYEIDWLTAWGITDRMSTLGVSLFSQVVICTFDTKTINRNENCRFLSILFKNCKAFAKDSLKYVPVIGWCWWFAEFLFLQRNWTKDKHTIETKLKELFEYENPVSVFVYF